MWRDCALQHNNARTSLTTVAHRNIFYQVSEREYLQVSSIWRSGIWASSGRRSSFKGVFIGLKVSAGTRDLALHFDHDDKSFYVFLAFERGMS